MTTRNTAPPTAVAMLAVTAGAGLLASPGTAVAASTAKVRIVDHYHHGRVEVTVNGLVRHLRQGDTKGVAVTPDPDGHDTASVRSMRHEGCGLGDGSDYFTVGHTYRMVIYEGGDCQVGGGRTVPSPYFRIVKTG